jgi:hypothetical protein
MLLYTYIACIFSLSLFCRQFAFAGVYFIFTLTENGLSYFQDYIPPPSSVLQVTAMATYLILSPFPPFAVILPSPPLHLSAHIFVPIIDELANEFIRLRLGK